MAVDAPAPPSPRSGLRAALARGLAILSLAVGGWAAAVWATGGLVIRLGSIRLSSRNPRNAFAIAAASAVLVWFIAGRADRRRFRYASASVAARLKPHTGAIVAALAAAFVLFIGITWRIGTAAGADTYGYVSQAELWLRGLPRIDEPLLKQVDWPNAARILAPVGSYRAGPDGKTIVPVYPPGFPLVLALFEAVGGRNAVFYAVPIFGAGAVVATYALGLLLGGRAAGAVAAVLMATSPPFVFQNLFAMSDVPVTMWWALSLLVFANAGPFVALGAGLAAGIAILTRPNLAPLALVPAAVLAWQALRSRAPHRRAWWRVVLFCAGTAAGCIVLAVVNARLYGSPLTSGYSPASVSYSLKHIPTNARLYAAWTLQSQTVLVFCAIAAPMAIAWHATDDINATRRGVFGVAVGVLAVTVASYLPYEVFDRWFWVRFLLPAWPSLVVLMSLGLLWLCRRVAGRRGGAIALAAVVAVACRNVLFLQRDGMFKLQEGERKSPAIGRYITESMPARAVFLAKEQTGSVRYYSGRLTLRFDMIPPSEVDRIVADLVRLGYHPYALFEEGEEDEFRHQFAERSLVGALDWPPIVQLHHSTRIQIYDLIDVQRQKSAVRAPKVVF